MRNGVLIVIFVLSSLYFSTSGNIITQYDFVDNYCEYPDILPLNENMPFCLLLTQELNEDLHSKYLKLFKNEKSDDWPVYSNTYYFYFIISQYNHHLLNNHIDLPPPGKIFKIT